MLDDFEPIEYGKRCTACNGVVAKQYPFEPNVWIGKCLKCGKRFNIVCPEYDWPAP